MQHSYVSLLYTVTGNYVWDDGTVIDYVNWTPGSLNQGSDCVGLYAESGRGTWMNEDCFATGGLACQINARMFIFVKLFISKVFKLRNVSFVVTVSFAVCSVTFTYIVDVLYSPTF